MSEAKKPIIGLTGGIASGKSTVARVLRDLGVQVVDADQLAREVVAKGSPGLAAIREAFGDGVLTAQGELDRPALGAIVFDDDDARQQLNAITHPRVAELSLLRLAEAQQGGTPYVVYEVPLLVETGLHKSMDATVVVAAEPTVQLARVMERDGLSETEARARIASQYPLEKKIEVADYVVDNSGTLAELEAKARELHSKLLNAPKAT